MHWKWDRFTLFSFFRFHLLSHLRTLWYFNLIKSVGDFIYYYCILVFSSLSLVHLIHGSMLNLSSSILPLLCTIICLCVSLRDFQFLMQGPFAISFFEIIWLSCNHREVRIYDMIDIQAIYMMSCPCFVFIRNINEIKVKITELPQTERDL